MSPSHAAKPRRSARPDRAALLGVELRGDDVVARDHGAELDAVVGDAEHVGGIVGRAVVRVHEVEVPARRAARSVTGCGRAKRTSFHPICGTRRSAGSAAPCPAPIRDTGCRPPRCGRTAPGARCRCRGTARRRRRHAPTARSARSCSSSEASVARAAPTPGRIEAFDRGHRLRRADEAAGETEVLERVRPHSVRCRLGSRSRRSCAAERSEPDLTWLEGVPMIRGMRSPPPHCSSSASRCWRWRDVCHRTARPAHRGCRSSACRASRPSSSSRTTARTRPRALPYRVPSTSLEQLAEMFVDEGNR